MTHCKYCGCSGWFFMLNAAGLCANCAHIVALDVAQRRELLREDAERAARTLNPGTRLARLEQMIANLRALEKYEEKDIPTVEGSPKEMLRARQEELDRALLEVARQETELTLQKVAQTSEPHAKIRVYNDLLLRLADYREQSSAKEPFVLLQRRVRDAVYQIELDLRVNRAKAFEQAADKQQALQAYQEALVYLKALDMDPELRLRHVAHLNGKLKELQGS